MTFVYVALDYKLHQDNLRFIEEFANSVDSDKYGFKINLSSVANFKQGEPNPYQLIQDMKQFNKPLFVDLKMWYNSDTMIDIAAGCRDLGVDIINLYAHAGNRFIKEVKSELKANGGKTKLFALTVLTHYSEEDTQKLYGKSLEDTVKMFADIGYGSGVDGIILPGTQLNTVKDLNILKMCPGIRPEWYSNKTANNQKEFVTPTEAVLGGADYLVVGTPIRDSYNRADSLQRIVNEIELLETKTFKL